VLGGKPIRDGEIAETCGNSNKTISRWREVLLSGDYISARRTPYGYVYGISKPKKWQKEIGQKCPVSTAERSDTDGERSDKNETRSDIYVRNKEERQENTGESEGAFAQDNPGDGKAIQFVWEHYTKTVQPGEGYTLTPHRKAMISDRLREVMEEGLKRADAVNVRLIPALEEFANDDYHQGRKKGFEHVCLKGIEYVFGTREKFEDWLMRHNATAGTEEED
jgi:hypothetical protein